VGVEGDERAKRPPTCVDKGIVPRPRRSPPALPAADHRGRVWEPSQGSHDDRIFAAHPNPTHLALAALQTWQRAAGGSFLRPKRFKSSAVWRAR
jgi:hypothetical protein